MGAVPAVAVLIPCLDEASTVAGVVRAFREALPQSTVFVYDNGSSDETATAAAAAGAEVRNEPLRGKGNVVRRMFREIEADIYILVDGDGTYDAASAPRLVAHFLKHNLDALNAARAPISEGAYRPGHRLGNALLGRLVTSTFGNRITDIFSGYKLFSRSFVKSFPALASGFEIEVELVVYALELGVPVDEIPAPYRERPQASHSKLSTVRDGIRILLTILYLIREERPLQSGLALFIALAAASLGLAIPVVLDYLDTGLVLRFPTAILCTGLMLLAFMCLGYGLVLDSVSHGRREMRRLWYLANRQYALRDGPER